MQEISAILGLVFGSCLCLFFFLARFNISFLVILRFFLLYFVVVVVVCGQIVRRMVMRIHGYRHTLELALEQSVLLHGSGRAQRWPGNGTGHTLQWNVPHFSYGRSLSLSSPALCLLVRPKPEKPNYRFDIENPLSYVSASLLEQGVRSEEQDT